MNGIWQIINENSQKEFYDFLCNHELDTIDFFSTINLSSDLLSKKNKIYLAEYLDNNIISILFLTINGYIIFYSKDLEFNINRASFIKKLIKKYCTSKIQFIFPISYKEYFLKEFKFNSFFDYYIMKYTRLTDINININKNYIFKIATLDDLEILKDIHYNYLAEEVFSRMENVNKNIAFINLKKTIEDYKLYFIYDAEEQKVVSKININLETKNYIRLGGVYTDKNHRNKKLALFLITQFLKDHKNIDKSIILFVKTNNIKAYSLYSKIGFEVFNQCTAIYF